MPNRLIHEASPYLRQHAENPVDWYPWGQEAFERAKMDDKPIHLSVGYAACHWCHVMAHESFEDPRVARFLNERFVNIKVDRQERPDVDDVYQKVVQMMGQSGGWPLTVFLSPQGEPFFGGTYFPPRDGYGRPSFARVLENLSMAWRDRRSELKDNIAQFKQGYSILAEREVKAGLGSHDDAPTRAALVFAENTDPQHGGLGGAPKFPNPSCYDLVLRVYQRTRNSTLLQALALTLNRMAAGGIYDHLAGGFARYSVDEKWAVPHFEKMLYDNAQLVKLYADAYRMSQDSHWRCVFEETIAYVLRDMAHPEGGFYSSEDADSEGEEGKFYVWTPAQIKHVLGDSDGEFACRMFGVSEQGNFEHGATVLHRPLGQVRSDEQRFAAVKQRLFEARNQRVRPMRDENILTGWNALMMQGLCAAFQATGNDEYLTAARRAADFCQRHLTTPGFGLRRSWRDGTSKVHAFLDDYAYLTNALLDLYECCFEQSYLVWAEGLADSILSKFWDNGLYLSPNDAEPLIHRPRAPHDNAWPSGVSTSAFALLRIHELTGDRLYIERVEALLRMFGSAASDNPFGFAHLLSAMEFLRSEPSQIVFAGDRQEVRRLAEGIHRTYLPSRVLAYAADVEIGKGRTDLDGRPTAYVCRRQTCASPVTTVTELLDTCSTP